MAEEVLSDCLNLCATDLTGACLSACLQDQGWGLEQQGSSGLPVWLAILLACLLVPLSALFSGLTLGLLSLDLFSLKIVEKAGDSKEQEYARKIIPLRRNGNLLLCTLLLGNTLVNNAISIVLADVTTGVIGLIIATSAILLLGEILPQAVCSRHGLKIGAHSHPVVLFFMLIFFPITYPISLALNAMLGRDIGTVYSQSELKRLIELHVTDPVAQAESGLTVNDHRLIMGALEYKDKRVRDVMTTLEQSFMLERSARLDFQTMLQIYKSGFTRIPVYEGSMLNVVGILYAKDLILLDPDDEVEVSAVLPFRSHHDCHIFDGVKLDQALQHFLTTGNHMLIAHRQPSEVLEAASQPELVVQPRPEDFQITGLITLEDVLEELIKAEIVDETDVYEDVNIRKPRASNSKNPELDGFMAMFEHKLSSNRQLTPQEIQAVCAFLSLNVEEFAALSKNTIALKGLVRHADVFERGLSKGDDMEALSVHSMASSEAHPLMVGRPSDAVESDLLLYQRGKPSTYFTLILQGKVMILTGAEEFQFELGPWSVLGNKALDCTGQPYVADFDAVAVAPCRILRIDRAAYIAALRASQYSVVIGSHNVKHHIRSALALKDDDPSAAAAAATASAYSGSPPPHVAVSLTAEPSPSAHLGLAPPVDQLPHPLEMVEEGLGGPRRSSLELVGGLPGVPGLQGCLSRSSRFSPSRRTLGRESGVVAGVDPPTLPPSRQASSSSRTVRWLEAEQQSEAEQGSQADEG